MNKNFRLLFRVVIVLILATVLVGGCGKEYTVEDGVISEVTMTTAVGSTGQPLQPTDVFAADAEAFYCSLKLSHFPPGTKIKAEWVFVKSQEMVGIGENIVLRTYTGTVEGDGYTSIVLANPGVTSAGWPKGEYKVVLSVDGEEKERTSVSFRVE